MRVSNIKKENNRNQKPIPFSLWKYVYRSESDCCLHCKCFTLLAAFSITLYCPLGLTFLLAEMYGVILVGLIVIF